MAIRKVQAVQDKRIDDLKDYMAGQFSLLVKGQEAMFRKFDEHAAEDKRQFEQINANVLTAKSSADQGIREAKAAADAKFEQIDLKASEAKGAAVATGKVWGVLSGLGATGILGTVWEIFSKFHGR
jgi:hypothetical protein